MKAATGTASFNEGNRSNFETAMAVYFQMHERAKLLFGEDSPVGQAAVEVSDKATDLLATVMTRPIPWDDATRKLVDDQLEPADHAHNNLARKMNMAIRPHSWKP
jgi:hypothetical protein